MIAGGAEKVLIAPQIANHLPFLEGELANRDWFAGDTISGADIQMSFSARGRRHAGRPRRPLPEADGVSLTVCTRGRHTRRRSSGAAPTLF